MCGGSLRSRSVRGCLALTVVLSHIAVFTNIYAHGFGPMNVKAGPGAIDMYLW